MENVNSSLKNTSAERGSGDVRHDLCKFGKGQIYILTNC